MIKKFLLIIYIFFFSSKEWKKPKKKDFLIYDYHLSNILIKYLGKQRTNIFYSRFLYKEKIVINIIVLIKMLINFRFSYTSYLYFYLKYARPKVIFTLIDNNFFFYKIKKIFPDSKTVIIQNALRTTQHDIFYNIKKLRRNKDLFCDYFFVYKKSVGELYKSFLKGNYKSIGSFISNSITKTTKKKTYDFMYISTYKGQPDNEIYIPKLKFTRKDLRKKEIKILYSIKKFFQKNKKYKLSILGARSNKELIAKEKIFFSQIFKGINYNFIPRTPRRDTYRLVDKSKVIISIDSSLGYEALSRGNKVIFFTSVRGSKFPLNSSNLGWPDKISNRGYFWTDKTSSKEVLRILSKIFKIPKKIYNKQFVKVKNLLINTDFGNKVFKDFLRQF